MMKKDKGFLIQIREDQFMIDTKNNILHNQVELWSENGSKYWLCIFVISFLL